MPNFNPVAAAALFHEREVRLTTLPGAVVRASVPAHECIVVKEPPYGASESFSLSVRDPGSFIVSGIHRHLDETASSTSYECLISFLSNVRFGIKFWERFIEIWEYGLFEWGGVFLLGIMIIMPREVIRIIVHTQNNRSNFPQFLISDP